MGEWYDERSPEDLKNMALNIHNMKQVLIPFSAFLLWGWYKEILLWASLLFLGMFLPKKKKKAQMLRISSDGFIFVVSIWTGLSRLSWQMGGGDLMLFVSGNNRDFLSATFQPLISCRNPVLWECGVPKLMERKMFSGWGMGGEWLSVDRNSRFVPVLESGGEFS